MLFQGYLWKKVSSYQTGYIKDQTTFVVKTVITGRKGRRNGWETVSPCWSDTYCECYRLFQLLFLVTS